jgi:hypothetical protein
MIDQVKDLTYRWDLQSAEKRKPGLAPAFFMWKSGNLEANQCFPDFPSSTLIGP